MTIDLQQSKPHELMKLIRKRVDQKPSIPMTQIAAELGYDVDDLCAFIMAYKTPRYRKPVNNTRFAPALPRDEDDSNARRFTAWKRAHDAAAAARNQQ